MTEWIFFYIILMPSRMLHIISMSLMETGLYTKFVMFLMLFCYTIIPKRAEYKYWLWCRKENRNEK